MENGQSAGQFGARADVHSFNWLTSLELLIIHGSRSQKVIIQELMQQDYYKTDDLPTAQPTALKH